MPSHPKTLDLQLALLAIVKRHLQAHRLSLRAAERQLGLGHGTLGHLFRRNTDLRFRHVEIFANLLGLTSRELLFMALQEQPLEATPDTEAPLPRGIDHANPRSFALLVAAELRDVLKPCSCHPPLPPGSSAP